MQIELKSIKIRDLVDGYANDPDAGVRGYHGRLDIRPPYQREFRYDEKQQQAVVETVLKGFPLQGREIGSCSKLIDTTYLADILFLNSYFICECPHFAKLMFISNDPRLFLSPRPDAG